MDYHLIIYSIDHVEASNCRKLPNFAHSAKSNGYEITLFWSVIPWSNAIRNSAKVNTPKWYEYPKKCTPERRLRVGYLRHWIGYSGVGSACCRGRSVATRCGRNGYPFEIDPRDYRFNGSCCWNLDSRDGGERSGRYGQ